MQFVWEGQLSGVYFAVETLDSLQARCDRRKTWNWVSCALDLLYPNTFHLKTRPQGLVECVDLFTVLLIVVRVTELFHFQLMQQFFLLCLFDTYCIGDLTFYIKFLTTIRLCLFSFLYFAVCANQLNRIWYFTVCCLNYGKKNRRQVCLLFVHCCFFSLRKTQHWNKIALLFRTFPG